MPATENRSSRQSCRDAASSDCSVSTPWADRLGVDRAAVMLREAINGCHMDGDVFVFHDLARLRRRLHCLSDCFPLTAMHTIAIKANPLVRVLETIVQLGFGLEAASIEEVALARKAGCPASRIVFDSLAKTRDEIALAISQGIAINADNLSELERMGGCLESIPPSSTLGLRINPQVGTGSINTTSVAGQDSKFGVPLSRRKDILQAFHRYPWLNGLHAHVGSQGCGMQMLVDSAKELSELRSEIHQELGQHRVTTLDIGGGLPAIYTEDQPIVELGEYAQKLRDQVPSLFDEKTRIVTEFGRAIHASCGIAFSRIEYVKSPNTAVVHVGADMFLRWVYHPQDWSHEIFVLDAQGRVKNSAARPTTVVGPLCFGGDVLARGIMLPAVEPGDWIGIRDVGAYTLSMWSRHCSRGMPLVLGYDDGEISVLRRRESPEDIVTYWS